MFLSPRIDFSMVRETGTTEAFVRDYPARRVAVRLSMVIDSAALPATM